MSNKEATTTVSDEIVIEALLNDAKKFKSKWELNVNEPTRSRPNTRFLQRTLRNVMSVNERRLMAIDDEKNNSHRHHNERSRKRSQSTDGSKSKDKKNHSRSRSRSPKKTRPRNDRRRSFE